MHGGWRLGVVRLQWRDTVSLTCRALEARLAAAPAGVGVDDRGRVAGEVQKELLASVMVLAHHEIELAGIGVIGLGGQVYPKRSG